MRVDVQIGRRSEALDGRDRAAVGLEKTASTDGETSPTVSRSLGVLKLASLPGDCRSFVDANTRRPHWL